MSNSPIFISYCHSDENLARQIGELLRKNGLNTWSDQQIEPGEDWESAFEDAIMSAKALLFVVSPQSPNSPWFNVELDAALSRAVADDSIRAIPVLTKGIRWGQLPAPLRRRVGVDISFADETSSPEFVERALAELARSVAVVGERTQ